jgi:hypothetical protein
MCNDLFEDAMGVKSKGISFPDPEGVTSAFVR